MANVLPDELAEGLLRDGVELQLVGRGRSMWPVIADGDRIVARPIRGVPRPGQIVVLRTARGIVTHRLVALRGPFLMTRGDWLEAEDPPAGLDALLGVVDGIHKRYLTVDLRTAAGTLVERALYLAGRLLGRIRAMRPIQRIRRSSC